MPRLVNPYIKYPEAGAPPGGTPHPTLNVELQCHYTLDEDGSTARADSLDVLDLEAVNNPPSEPGLIGNALKIVYIDQGVYCRWLDATASQFDLKGTDFSVSFWMKGAAGSPTRANFCESGAITPQWAVSYRYSRFDFRVYISGVDTRLNTGDVIIADQWNHAVFTGNAATGFVQGYVNNVQVTDATFDLANMDTAVGEFQLPPSENTPTLNIDEFAIWHKELTVAEVGDLYNSGAGLTYDPGIPGFPEV